MLNTVCTIMILLMYFLAGINKAMNFKQTVNGFKNMFMFKNLPQMFYDLAIALVVVLELVAPLIIVYSLQTNLYTDLAYYSCVSLAAFTVLATLIYHFPPSGAEYYAFIKNVTATGSLLLLSTFF